jgi:hypothetical protein
MWWCGGAPPPRGRVATRASERGASSAGDAEAFALDHVAPQSSRPARPRILSLLLVAGCCGASQSGRSRCRTPPTCPPPWHQSDASRLRALRAAAERKRGSSGQQHTHHAHIAAIAQRNCTRHGIHYTSQPSLRGRACAAPAVRGYKTAAPPKPTGRRLAALRRGPAAAQNRVRAPSRLLRRVPEPG